MICSCGEEYAKLRQSVAESVEYHRELREWVADKLLPPDPVLRCESIGATFDTLERALDFAEVLDDLLAGGSAARSCLQRIRADLVGSLGPADPPPPTRPPSPSVWTEDEETGDLVKGGCY